MPRRPVVSRTLTILEVQTLRTDVLKEKTKHESFYLADGKYKSKEDVLKKIRELYDDDRMVTSRIKNVSKVTAFITMDPQTFIENAEDINILNKGEQKQ